EHPARSCQSVATMPEPVALTPPAGSTAAELARRLDHELGLVPGPQGAVSRTWYDTADWRLFAAGLVLEREVVEAQPPAPSSFLRVRRVDRLVPEAEVVADAVPARARDLPEPVAALVASAAGNRVLVARCTAQGRVRILRLLDGESKTVLRVVLGQEEASPVEALPGSGAGGQAEGEAPAVALAPVLVVAPVRGH